MTKLEQLLSTPTGDPTQDALRAEMLESVRALNAWSDAKLVDELIDKLMAEAKKRGLHD